MQIPNDCTLGSNHTLHAITGMVKSKSNIKKGLLPCNIEPNCHRVPKNELELDRTPLERFRRTWEWHNLKFLNQRVKGKEPMGERGERKEKRREGSQGACHQWKA